MIRAPGKLESGEKEGETHHRGMTTIAETYITFYSLQNTVSQNGVPGRLVLDSQGKAKMQIPRSHPIPDESESQWRGGRDGWNSGI